MQWQPRSTIGPPPACAASQNQALCGPGMRLARARPEDLADLARAHRLERLQRLRGVDEILEVAREEAGALDGVEHPLRLGGGPGERLRAEDRLPVGDAEPDHLLVELVREPDDDGVRLRMGDRLLEVGRGERDVVLARESIGALLRARVDDVDAVAVALRVQRPRVEEPDQARSEHRHLMTVHVRASSLDAPERAR